MIWIVGMVILGVFCYLVYALIYPEKIHGQWFALHPGMKIPLFFP
ncbi:hypothetical protein AVP43_02811 [Geobacillus stearothermophilus]|nr:hypothetical protein AVP43_02811 [Geobacillus stearothermophilus]